MSDRVEVDRIVRAVTYPGPADSKYTRGVVSLLTGSVRYPGAALLGVNAAARCGAGYVRYEGPAAAQNLILLRRPEVVMGASLATHTDSWVIGSGFPSVSPRDLGQEDYALAARLLASYAGNPDYLGTGLDGGPEGGLHGCPADDPKGECEDGLDTHPKDAQENRSVIRSEGRPDGASCPGDRLALHDSLWHVVKGTYCLVDAGALDFFAQAAANRPLTEAASLRHVVVTPHAGEAASMLTICGYGVTRQEVESSPRKYAKILADELECVVVLKGSPTIIYDSHASHELLQLEATHWLATAGTGDVLAGLLGALLAQNASAMNEGDLDIQTAAAAGVFLHSLAAAIAAGDYNSQKALLADPTDSRIRPMPAGHPICAMDVAQTLPAAIGLVLDSDWAALYRQSVIDNAAAGESDTDLPGFLQ